MRQFPLSAQIYIWTVVAFGAAAFTFAAAWLPTAPGKSGLLLTGCVLAAVAAAGRVPLFGVHRKGEASDQNATMSLGFVPTFLLLLSLGPLAGMIATSLNALVVTCRPRRLSYYYQVLFSIAAVALSAFGSGLILRAFGLANGDPWTVLSHLVSREASALWPILGIFLATVAYYLCNTILVALAIAMSTRRNPWELWRDHFLWTGPGYFAGASCAALAYGLMPLAPRYPIAAVAFLLVTIPIPTVIFYVFKYHREKELSRSQHIADLQASKEELEKSNEELERSREDLQHLYNSTVESLALAIDAKDRYTKEHIQRVRGIAVHLARELGLSGNDLKAIETGAMLHDIGKIAVPEHILTKPGRLTEEEFEKIKLHPDMGARILQPVPFPFPVLAVVRSHHERWDGSGYPDGLRGEDIPLGGRILAVADVYDALVTDRAYRQGWTHEQAVEYIEQNSGRLFDAKIVAAFRRVLERSPRLQVMTGELAVNDVGPEWTDIQEGVTEDINRASFEYMSLYEISQTVADTLNLSDTLNQLTAKIKHLFNASTCVLTLLNDRDTVAVQRAMGVNETFFLEGSVRRGEGPTGGVAETGQGIVLTRWEPGDLPGNDIYRDTGWVPIASGLIAPLTVEDTIIGTVNVYHTRAETFGVEDLRVLTAVGAHAARAIQKAREFDRTRHSALTDPLTGLYNAHHLGNVLDKELARAAREGQPLTVLVLDLDNFKPVNDRFGHPRGNEVLRDLGSVFQSAVRSGDLVARYAGDEFVIVLPGTGNAEAEVVMEKVRSAVSHYDPRQSGGDLGDITIGVSIGAASFPQDGTDASTLIACADRVMYRDKSLRKSHRSEEVLPDSAPAPAGDALRLAVGRGKASV